MNTLDLVLLARLLGFPLANHFSPYVKRWPDLTDSLQALAYMLVWIFYGGLAGVPKLLGKENAGQSGKYLHQHRWLMTRSKSICLKSCVTRSL